MSGRTASLEPNCFWHRANCSFATVLAGLSGVRVFSAVIIAALLLSAPADAVLGVAQVIGIPAKPGQSVTALKADPEGNLVAAGIDAQGFVTKITRAGDEVFYSELPGAAGFVAIALDGNGDINAVSVTLSGQIFVWKLRGTDGEIIYATSLAGGAGIGSGNLAITVDAAGQTVVAAMDFGILVPTTPGAYASPPGGNLTGLTFLFRLSAMGEMIFTASYGGQHAPCYTGMTCSGAIQVTKPAQVWLDAEANIWLAGTTNTDDLPLTSDALTTATCAAFECTNGFLAEFSGDGSRLLYATYIGSASFYQNIQVVSAAADAGGHVWLVGTASSANIPVTTNALQKQLTGNGSFLMEFDPATNTLLYASYFSGSDPASTVRLGSIAVDVDGTLLFAGTSNTMSLPVPVSGFKRGSALPYYPLPYYPALPYSFVAEIGPSGSAIAIGLPSETAGSGLVFVQPGLAAVVGLSSSATLIETNGSSGPGIFGIANSASLYVVGGVAPGEFIRLYGENLGPGAPVDADPTSGQAPLQLGGIQVAVNDILAPLIQVQNDEIDAVVPFGIAGSATARITVSTPGGAANRAILRTVKADPEAFVSAPPFLGPPPLALALNADGTVNSLAHPALPGSVVALFGTGFGSLVPQPADGGVLSDPLPALINGVQVVCSSQPLDVVYTGPAPTMIAGVIQVNFRIPPQGGLLDCQFNVAGFTSSQFSVVASHQ